MDAEGNKVTECVHTYRDGIHYESMIESMEESMEDVVVVAEESNDFSKNSTLPHNATQMKGSPIKHQISFLGMNILVEIDDRTIHNERFTSMTSTLQSTIDSNNASAGKSTNKESSSTEEESSDSNSKEQVNGSDKAASKLATATAGINCSILNTSCDSHVNSNEWVHSSDREILGSVQVREISSDAMSGKDVENEQSAVLKKDVGMQPSTESISIGIGQNEPRTKLLDIHEQRDAHSNEFNNGQTLKLIEKNHDASSIGASWSTENKKASQPKGHATVAVGAVA